MENILFFILIAAATVLFLFLPRKKQTKRFALGVLAFAFFFELVFCNFHSYHLLFGNYPMTELKLGQATVSGEYVSNVDGSLTVTGKTTLEFPGLDIPVGTVGFVLEYPDSNVPQSVAFSMDFKDVTYSATYRYGLATGDILPENDRSHTVAVDLSGEVSAMRVTLSPTSGSFTLRSIVCNRAVPMYFSPVRLTAFCAIALGLYATLCFPSFRETLEQRRTLFTKVAVALTGVFVLVALFLSLYQSGAFRGGLSHFRQYTGNQITKEIVDAFEAGQVSLLRQPSKELLELENPYDWGLRSTSGVTAAWDHLLFEGKYYSYYGIAPVLLLYLPYHLLTGFYFPAAESILLFSALGIIFLSALFMETVKRFFPRIPVNMAVWSLVVLQAASGVWYCLAYANFYEIAQSCGFLFTCAGFYFLLRSGVVGEGKIRMSAMALSSFCLSMAVLSRPTLVLYCMVAVIFLVFGFVKHRKTVGTGKPWQTVKYLLAGLGCYVFFGIMQMAYNYLRFGNILDFGIQYSLTINDFTQSQYHTDLAMIGFWNFLFAFPQIQTEFPFIFSNFSDLSVNGYYFIANENAIGILWRALPVFGYLGAVRAWKKLPPKRRLPALLLLGSCCVAAPLIIIFSIWESGYGVRYCADFSWQIILGAMCIWFVHYLSVKDDPFRADTRKYMTYFFALSAVLALAVNGALVLAYMPNNKLCLYLGRIFEFWK